MTLEVDQRKLVTRGREQLLSTPHVLEKFVLLGTTVPEADYKGPNKGKAVVVCSAGWSEEYGLTRIHPLDWIHAPTRWGLYRVNVRKAGYGDTRVESYEPANNHKHNRDFTLLKKRIDPATLKPELEQYKVESIREANERRMSLAIIDPDNLELRMVPTDRHEDDVMQWFRDDRGEIVKAKERYRWIPRLFFDELPPKSIGLQLRDWGVFEFMRKQPKYHRTLEDSQKHTIKALGKLENPSLFIGNIMGHRNTWLAIAVLNGLRG